MVLTPSSMIPLGTPAPKFSLPDAKSGKTLTLDDIAGDKGTVIMFICNHCPYVKHVQDIFTPLAKDYQARGIQFVAINSNDAESYPEDSFENMTARAEKLGYPFPYLYDESQNVAKAYKAACTPEFYLFDADLKCVYRGQLDESRPGNDVPVTGKDLRAAMDALLAGKSIDPNQKPSVGCNIKWKS